jgi:hypothetical protein
MLTLSSSFSEAQGIVFDLSGLIHSTHFVFLVIVTHSTSPRYLMKALLVILIATSNFPVLSEATLSVKMVAVMEMMVGCFLGLGFATSMGWLELAASTGVAMNIAANTTIAVIINFRFKSHHPFSHVCFPIESHTYG